MLFRTISWEIAMALRHNENPPKATCAPWLMYFFVASATVINLLRVGKVITPCNYILINFPNKREKITIVGFLAIIIYYVIILSIINSYIYGMYNN